MSNQKDEQEFEKYLQGNSDLSKRYHAESTEEPSAHLDNAIISAAKEATTESKPGPDVSSTRWYIPLSLAAVVIISFSVVFKIYDKSLPGNESQIEILSKSANIQKDKLEANETDKSVGAAQSRESFSDETANIEPDSTGDARVLNREMTAPSATPAPPAREMQTEEMESTAKSLQSLPVEEKAEKILTPESMRDFSDLKEQPYPASAPLSPQEWLKLINELWKQGNKAGAQNELRNFVVAYPDYPEEQLEFQIPHDMDMSVINK